MMVYPVYMSALGNPQSANSQKMRIEDSIRKSASIFDFCWEIRNPQIRKMCGLWIPQHRPASTITLY